MVRITSFSKQVIAVFLALTLFINPAFSNTVGGSIGGWQVVSNVANGIGAKVTATKEVMINGASKVATGVANITPNASNVGKFIGKNLAAAAVVAAMDLLLDGVDYVLDPANNSVTYRDKSALNNTPKCYQTANSCFPSMSAAAAGALAYDNKQYSSYKSVRYTISNLTIYLYDKDNVFANLYTAQYLPNPAYNPDLEDKPKTIPLSNIASQVIEQAEKDIKAGNPTSPAVVLARTVAQAEIAEAEADDSKAPPIVNKFQQSASIPTSQTAEGEITHPPIIDPATGEVTPVPPSGISLDFPVFCSWAPSLCLMADRVQEAISDVTAEYTEPVKENTDTKLELPDESQDQNIDTDISFGGSCPASRSVPVSFAGISTEIEFSFQWFCEIASIAKPVIISISAFAAALIVAGVRTEDD